MECIDMGLLVGYSYGTCSYENITIKNSSIANYQRYTGAVVGEVNGTQVFKNITVDHNTVVASMWGDFDASLGGIIGGKWGDAHVRMEDCYVACQIDAHNDVISANQWHAYRRCGMLIGNAEESATIDGRTIASAPFLEATNCTVVYGDWAKYTYCEFAGTGYPYVRVQAGIRNSAYSNPRYGHPTDAAGKQVVDDNHTHNEGEDHFLLREFNQLFGGGQGVYGGETHLGVTVHKVNEETIKDADNLDGQYIFVSDDYGHWYEPVASKSRTTVKLLYDAHYDVVDPKLISAENGHYHECDECGAPFDLEAHTPKAGWEKSASGHWHECTVCEGTYAFASHEESDWIVDTEPEIGVEGSQHKECTICGYTPLGTEEIPALKPAFDGALLAIVARYSQRFDVLVATDHATVTGDMSIKYKRNGIVQITPDEGYVIVNVIANGISMGAVDAVKFSKVMADPTLIVITAPILVEEEVVEEIPAETVEVTDVE